MKRKRYSTVQIVAAIKQHELGTPAADVIREQLRGNQSSYLGRKRPKLPLQHLIPESSA